MIHQYRSEIDLICFTNLINRVVASCLQEPIFHVACQYLTVRERSCKGLLSWLVGFIARTATLYTRLVVACTRSHASSCYGTYSRREGENAEGDSSARRSRERAGMKEGTMCRRTSGPSWERVRTSRNSRARSWHTVASCCSSSYFALVSLYAVLGKLQESAK